MILVALPPKGRKVIYKRKGEYSTDLVACERMLNVEKKIELDHWGPLVKAIFNLQFPSPFSPPADENCLEGSLSRKSEKGGPKKCLKGFQSSYLITGRCLVGTPKAYQSGSPTLCA